MAAMQSKRCCFWKFWLKICIWELNSKMCPSPSSELTKDMLNHNISFLVLYMMMMVLCIFYFSFVPFESSFWHAQMRPPRREFCAAFSYVLCTIKFYYIEKASLLCFLNVILVVVLLTFQSIFSRRSRRYGVATNSSVHCNQNP